MLAVTLVLTGSTLLSRLDSLLVEGSVMSLLTVVVVHRPAHQTVDC